MGSYEQSADKASQTWPQRAPTGLVEVSKFPQEQIQPVQLFVDIRIRPAPRIYHNFLSLDSDVQLCEVGCNIFWYSKNGSQLVHFRCLEAVVVYPMYHGQQRVEIVKQIPESLNKTSDAIV